jgi:predicted NAD/FAD-binding protein
MDLVVRVAIHGQRTRPDGAILVEVDGTDVSFDVAPAVRPCSR